MMNKKMYIILFLVLMVSFYPIPTVYGEFSEAESKIEIYVNLWNNQLYLIKEGEIVKSYAIGPGTVDTPTPIGDFRIVEKSSGWGNGFGSRWLGLNVPFGSYGIHGTNKPHLVGRYVSHGCVRMRNRDIEELYALVPKNTPVRIEGPILGREGLDYRILVWGSRGSLVQMVQNRLQAAGYYNGKAHGVFDKRTEYAVKKFQRDRHLPITGQIQFIDLVELGIVE